MVREGEGLIQIVFPDFLEFVELMLHAVFYIFFSELLEVYQPKGVKLC
jgi:hypothetical protein